MRLRDPKGQAVVEYAIVFPIQLMITLAIVQLAHIFVAKHLISYSAYCGARAALVAKTDERDADAEDAAVIALSAVAGPAGGAGEAKVDIPGWGELPRSGAARLKTTVAVEERDADGIPVVECKVEHLYQLTIPVGNYIAYQLGEMFISMPDIEETYGEPHLLVTGQSMMVKPWDTTDEVDEE